MSRPVFALLIVAAALLALGAGAAQAETKKIVLVPTKQDHPWGTHTYRHKCRLLASCLNNADGVEAVVSPELGWPPEEMLEGVDALVYYSGPAGSIVLSEKHRETFNKLMNQGVGYTAIHWATDASTKHGQRYLEVLGGWFNTEFFDVVTSRSQLKQLNSDHPICRGWEPFKLWGEFYLDLKFQEGITPLLEVEMTSDPPVIDPEMKGRRQTVMWAYERPDGGRSFGTTLGHFHGSFARRAFRRALVNGILWSAKAEIPEGGADVRVSSDLLMLPPVPRKDSEE